jgi:hypothetical protein
VTQPRFLGISAPGKLFYLVRKERPPGYINGDEVIGRGKMSKIAGILSTNGIMISVENCVAWASSQDDHHVQAR